MKVMKEEGGATSGVVVRFANTLEEEISETYDGLTVGSVCRDGNVENVLVQTEDLANIRAERSVRRKDEQSVDFRSLYYGIVYAEFASAAKHSVTHDAAQFSRFYLYPAGQFCSRKSARHDHTLFYVGRAAYYLKYFATRVHHANMKVV